MKTNSCSIEIYNLKKVFYRHRGIFSKCQITALDTINIKIRKGEIFGLVGQNGAGKTTLIKILTTLITPTEGRVIINGFNIKDVEKIKPVIGLIYYDERSFYPRLSVKQNLEFIATLYGLPAGVIKERIRQMLDLIGLQDEEDIWVQSLSTGMKQRLAIARGVIHDPDIIFIDELTKGIDPWEAQKILIFIKQFLNIKLGKTIFFVTHDLGQVKSLSDSVALLHKGKIKLHLDSVEINNFSEDGLLKLFESYMKNGENNDKEGAGLC